MALIYYSKSLLILGEEVTVYILVLLLSRSEINRPILAKNVCCGSMADWYRARLKS